MKYISSIIVSLFIFLQPLSAFAAIALDTSAQLFTGASPASPSSVSYTVTGSNPALVVGFITDHGVVVSSVKYAGVAMTQIASATDAVLDTYIYALSGAATGANNVTFTFSGGNLYRANASSYTGVGGTDGGTATASAQTSPFTMTLSITTTKDNDWLVMYAYDGDSKGMTAGTNTTQRINANFSFLGDTNAAQTPAGSHSVAVNYGGTGGVDIRGAAVALYPSIVSVTPTSILGLIHSFWIF